MRALGEDPAELAALIDATHEDWRPANAFQARIAERLARLLWRMERAERLQESLAAQPVQRQEKHRQAVAEALRRQTMPQLDILELLREDAADPRYYTARGFFRDFCAAFGKQVKDEREKEILLLMHRLRKPPEVADEPGKTAAGPGKVAAGAGAGRSPLVGPSGARPERTLEPGGARCRDVLVGPNGARPEWTGEEGGDPSPDLLVGASGARPGGTPSGTREQVRPEGGVVADGPPQGSAAAAAPPKEDVYLSEMAEYDDDDFPVPWPNIAVAEGRERDDLRLELVGKANSLRKVIQAALEQALEEQEAPLSRLERDGLQATPHPHAELMRREEESCFRQFVRLGNFLMKLQNHAAKREENEGSSGYVDENTGWGQEDPVTNGPELVAGGREDAGQTVRSAEAEAGARESDVQSPGSEVRSPASEVRSPASEVGSERPSEVREAVAHGGMLNSEFRIPDNSRRRVPVPARTPDRYRVGGPGRRSQVQPFR